MSKLVGSYELSKANLYPTHQADFHLIISKRHKASARKPKDYLLIFEAGRFQYLSSLYPVIASDVPASSLEAEIWHLEHQRVNYELSIDRFAYKAEIRQISGSRVPGDKKLKSIS